MKTTNSAHHQRIASGFTLVELLVAMAVFAVLAAMSYSGLNSTLKTREITVAQAEKLHDLQMALTILQRDFTQLVDRPIRNEFGDIVPALITETSGQTLLEFSHNGWRNPAGQLRSTQRRVALALEEGVLYRYYWPHIYQGPQEEPVQAQLLTEIEQLTIEFQDAGKRWFNQWPPANSNNATLPVAIKLTLKFENEDEVSRLFDISGVGS